MRFVALDTETTGLNRNGVVSDGHRVIEIGCVEIMDGVVTGKYFHAYVNPGTPVDERATKIHGIKNDFLDGKPTFSDVVGDFLKFVGGSTLVIHNASFDIEFLNKEFDLLPEDRRPSGLFYFIDTLILCRELFPGRRNDLNSLKDTFHVDIIRDKHGALLDAWVLACIFLRL